MKKLKITILFICVFFTQQLRTQIFTAPYQAVNYQKVVSNGLHFDGTDDYISLTRPVSDDFTIEFWMKTTQTGASGPYWYYGRGIIDAESPGGANDFGIALVANKLAFGTGNPDFTIVSNTIMNDGIWKHVAVTRTKSSGALKIYINGVLDNSGTAGNVSSLTAPTDIKIGKIQTSTNYFNGTLDDIRFWNFVRTQPQIQSTMNTELVGTESGLVAYYNCNQGVSNATNTGISTFFNETSTLSTYNGTMSNFALSGQISNWVVGKLDAMIPVNGLRLYVDAGKPRSYAGSGTVMTDLSPSANNMNITGTSLYYSNQGGNITFNGINTALTSVANSPITGASPRTVCIWYKPTTTTDGFGSLFWTGNSSISNSIFGLGFSFGKYQFWGSNNDNTDVNLSPTNNAWNFIAAAYGGGNKIYQYLNGTGNLNSINSPLTTTASPFTFSKSGSLFYGNLGSIMVYDRMLAKPELDKLFGTMKLSVPDGSSALNAAVSGLQLHIDYPALPSGWYWIKSPSMPNALEMYVDMTEDGGGYDFYPITAGPSVSYATTVSNGGTALGLDLVYPRSKFHWRAMSNAVNTIITAGKNGGGNYSQFFQTTYGVYRNTSAGNGSVDYSGKTMRSAEYGGITNVKDWRVKDGGIWWMRDATYSEPNGDYTSDGLLGMSSFPNPYNLTDIVFNDGNCCFYSTGNFYLVSTNAKKGVVYDNSLMLYIDPNVAGSYTSGQTINDLSPNLNHGTLGSSSYGITNTTPKKFYFNGIVGANASFVSSKFNTSYTGKTIMIAAKMNTSFGTNIYRALFGSASPGYRNFNLYIYQNGTNYQMHFSSGFSGSYLGSLSDVVPITTDQWYVFAVTQDATTTRYYLNGVLVGTTTGTTLHQYGSTTNEYLGISDNYWFGDIGTTMIYKRALSADEIMQNYNAIRFTYP